MSTPPCGSGSLAITANAYATTPRLGALLANAV